MKKRSNTNAPYKSKFEKRIAAYLKSRKIPYKYESRSFTYNSRVRIAAYCSFCGSTEIIVKRTYTPDFFLKNGVIIETKGKWTANDRHKMIDVRNSNPGLDIKMLFMQDNKINAQSKTRYSKWCEVNGFEYAIGEPKAEWLKD